MWLSAAKPSPVAEKYLVAQEIFDCGIRTLCNGVPRHYTVHR